MGLFHGTSLAILIRHKPASDCVGQSRRKWEVLEMNSLKTIAGSGLVLMLTLGAPVAWGQTMPDNAASSSTTGAYQANWSTQDNAALMDQNLTSEIKQAWSEGKNATAAMALQEHGEIAMDIGNEKQATQYFEAAEQELGSLKPDRTSSRE
jgi:hypothetical protein